MESPQSSPPQKTSFWDFGHKKVYIKIWERVTDFLTGFIFGYIFFFVIDIFLFVILILESELWLVIPVFIYLALLAFTFFKRKWIFYGILLSVALIIWQLYQARIQYF